MYNRRQFLLGTASLFSSTQVNALSFLSDKKLPEQLLLSACTTIKNQHYLAALTLDGKFYYKIPIPERAHGSIYHSKKQHAIYFGRSPSRHIYIIDVINKVLIQKITAGPLRHFHGHGVFDDTDRYLYVTENNYKEGKGCIGVYDVDAGYGKVAEFESYGIEPHQLLLLPGRNILAIANGGLLKHPESPKKILNKNNFTSSLSYIDNQSGVLLGNYHCPFSQHSLRHMAVNNEGKVFVGAQSYAEDPTFPLVFSHEGEGDLAPFAANEFIWQAHNQYTGSLAVHENTLAVTSPRGNIISFWDINKNSFQAKNHHGDIAGLLSYQQSTRGELTDPAVTRFFASTGQGFVLRVGANSMASTARSTIINQHYASQTAWDNHLFLASNITN